MTAALLADLMKQMNNQASLTTHEALGATAAKYVETLQRSNEQIVKLTNLLQKREESEKKDDILITDEVQESNGIIIVSDRELLEDVIGPVTIDYSRVNLVEQGFTFKRPSGLVCGCGQSFAAWKEEIES